MAPKPVDPGLLNYLRDADIWTRCSRSWAEAGRLLGICQHCERFTGAGCESFPGDDFRRLLTVRQMICDRWRSLHDGG